MQDLADVLTVTPSPVQWLQGTVKAITGDLLIINYGGAEIRDVAKLSSYTPVVGQLVHILSQQGIGMLAIGTSPVLNPPDNFPTPEAPVIINAISKGTHGPVEGAWELNVLEQEPVRTACFFYQPSDFTPLVHWALASVELELTLLSGGPSELALVSNLTPFGDLVLAVPNTIPLATNAVPVTGVPTWVTLPLEWGIMLANAEAFSIGLTSPLFTANYSGTGRLRFSQI